MKITSTPTHDFLRAALGAFIMKRPAPMQAPQGIDWNRAGRWVAAHGLEGVFCHTLNRNVVPGHFFKLWRQKNMAVLFENLQSLRVSARLFSILDNAHIRAVGMRGLVLAHKDYPIAGMRPMGDIDILIHPKDRISLLQTLQGQGHEPERVLRSQDVFRIEGVRFEVHWSFLTAKRYRNLLSSDLLLDSRQSIVTQDGRIYGLSDENEMIGLVTHAFIHHDLTVIKQLLDIGLYMVKPDMDWSYIETWCRSARLTRMFSITLHLVSQLFNLPTDYFSHSFGAFPSPRAAKTMHAYIDPLFGVQRASAYFTLKRNQLHVAENPLVKLMQLIGFFSATEISAIVRRYFEHNKHLPDES